MNKWQRILSLGLIGLTLLAGTFLLSRGIGPATVSGASQQVISEASGPAGQIPPGQLATTSSSERVSPVVVEMSDLPGGNGIGSSQNEHWLRGAIDLNENESGLSDVEVAALQAEALAMSPNSAIQNILSQVDNPQLQAPGLITGFESLDIDDCCNVGGRATPPSPQLAVGPLHIIAAVNVALEVYDKNGNSLTGPVRFSDFMAANSECDGDDTLGHPNANYDEAADRFIVAIVSDGTHYCIAVSMTSDPTGSWFVYAFPTPAGELFNYAQAGVGRNAIYVGSNRFIGSFVGGLVMALEKDVMYAGGAALKVEQPLGANDVAPQPLNLHGFAQGSWPATGPHYITANILGSMVLTLYTWDDPFGANIFTPAGTIDMDAVIGNSGGFPVAQPQSGGQNIGAFDRRIRDFEFRNGRGWVTMTVACNPGGGTVNCVRWAQIHLASAVVLQAGDFGSSGEYRSYPDLAVDNCNQMAVGYTKFSAATFPSIYVTGRELGDPLGTVQAEVILRAGDQTYASFETPPWRWGYTTGMTIDSDGETFWYLGDYSKSGVADPMTNWGTYIGAFSFGACELRQLHLPIITNP